MCASVQCIARMSELPCCAAAGVTVGGDKGAMAVSQAIRDGKMAELVNMLNGGSSPNGAIDITYMTTPLGKQTHLAEAVSLCTLGLDRYGCVAELLSRGADQSIKSCGLTPMEQATNAKNARLVAMLSAAGSNN